MNYYEFLFTTITTEDYQQDLLINALADFGFDTPAVVGVVTNDLLMYYAKVVGDNTNNGTRTYNNFGIS